MNLNAAIVGLGKAGLTIDLRKKNLIKSHSKAFFKHPKFNLIYSFEKEFKKREIFKKIYKKSSFQNLHSPCKLNPDIVSICVPTEDHKKCIKKVINNLNPKIILCEKPLSYSLKDSKYIRKLRRKKVKIFVNYTRNTNKNFINLKKIKKYNNIKGKVYYNNGFKNNASHYLNLMIFYLEM